ncbi:MAG: glycosyltransferase [Agathobacter sp.]
MKVAIVSNGIPVPDSPLLGIFELDQARALSKQGVDVTLLCLDLRSFRRKRKLGIDSGIIDDIKWYRLAFPLGNVPIEIYGIIGKMLFSKLYMYAFSTLDSPDIIHAHFYDMGLIAGPLANRLNIPFFITEHSSQVAKKEIGRRFKKEVKKAYQAADVVIAVGEGLKRRIYEHTGLEAIVINNVVDTSLYKHIDREHTGFGFIMTANLIPGKNPRMLLEAFNAVYKDNQDCYLGFIGDGIEKEYLEVRTKELGLEKHVAFYGRRKREEFSEIYSNYDFFVLPSNAETFGVVLIEAMACGLPVIATRCDGPEYFIDEKSGILVNVGDEKELQAAMETMIKNKENYNSNYLMERTKKLFSEESIAKQLISLYERFGKI